MAEGKNKVTKRITVGAIFAGVLMAGSLAFAAWTAGGIGNGYAKATTAQVLTTIDASASTTAQLYPGGTGDMKLRINNPNSYNVRVTSVTGSGSITSDKGAACNAATGVTFTNQSAQTLDVPAGTAVTFTLTGAVAMSNSSDNSCQGGIFTIPVTLVGVSN
jgi:hypothetical protein